MSEADIETDGTGGPWGYLEEMAGEVTQDPWDFAAPPPDDGAWFVEQLADTATDHALVLSDAAQDPWGDPASPPPAEGDETLGPLHDAWGMVTAAAGAVRDGIVSAAAEADLPPSGSAESTDWMQLKTDAADEARSRFSNLNQLIMGAVQNFHDGAITEVEGLDVQAPSADGMGAGLFTALSDIAAAYITVLLPEGALVAAVATEAAKTFSQMFVNHLDAAEATAQANSAQDRLATAQDELRRKVDDLARECRAAGNASWKAGSAEVGPVLDQLFAGDPWLRQLATADGDSDEKEGQIADMIIRDPLLSDPSDSITETLWQTFRPSLRRVREKLAWQEMSNLKRLDWLLEHHPNDDARRQSLEAMGADVPYWEEAVRLKRAGLLDELVDHLT